MINTQIIGVGLAIGATFLVGVSSVVRNLAPNPHPAAAFIEIHALEVMADGRVRQDRTVNADAAAIILAWAAQIEHADTSQQVRGCVGSSTWPYQSGRQAPEFDLSDWVGSPDCTLAALPRDVPLRPRVIFGLGDEQKPFVGAVFVVRQDGRIE